MLDNIDDLKALFRSRGTAIRKTRSKEHDGYVTPGFRPEDDPARISAGDLYCGDCGGPRRMLLRALYVPVNFPTLRVPDVSGGGSGWSHPTAISPSLFSLICSQCAARFLLAVVPRHGADTVLVLPESAGGIGTPNTPEAVRFYLDQAHLARSLGAFSAAVTMYRAALEQFLHVEGYRKRNLQPKIQELEAAVEEGTAPAWARDLDPEHWEVIRRLGNAAIHPNDGEVARQSALDGALVLEVNEVFSEVLDAAYERPRQRVERLERMRQARDRAEGRGPDDETSP